MPMSDADRAMIHEMRDLGVLKDEEHKRLPLNGGVILVCCSDGDQIDEVFDHMRDAAKATGAKPRIHTHALNGGALLASPHCPILGQFQTMRLLHTIIEQSIDLKGIRTIVLSVHAPCGAARLAKLNIVQLIAHMIEAKRALKSAIHDIKVLCVLHVDKGDGNKRTYVVTREQWDPFYQKLPKLDRSIDNPVVA